MGRGRETRSFPSADLEHAERDFLSTYTVTGLLNWYHQTDLVVRLSSCVKFVL